MHVIVLRTESKAVVWEMWFMVQSIERVFYMKKEYKYTHTHLCV